MPIVNAVMLQYNRKYYIEKNCIQSLYPMLYKPVLKKQQQLNVINYKHETNSL